MTRLICHLCRDFTHP